MSVSVTKVCCMCGTDVANSKRVKDAKGRYYCEPCRAKAESIVASGNQSEQSSISGQPSQKATNAEPEHAALDATSLPSSADGSTKWFDREKLSKILYVNLTPNMEDHPSLRKLVGAWFISLAFVGLVLQLFLPILMGTGDVGFGISLFIIVTSVGIGIDAAVNRIPVKLNSEYDPIHNGWLRWFGGCLVTWIIFAPSYFFKRLNTTDRTNLGELTLPPADLEAELRQLKRLVTDGILTEEEFTARKRSLLGLVST